MVITIGWWVIPAILNLILLLVCLCQESGEQKYWNRSLKEIGTDIVGFMVISSPIWLLYFVFLTMAGDVTLR